MEWFWQSLILSNFNLAFQRFHVETMAYGNQLAYYQAIKDSMQEGIFIDFINKGRGGEFLKKS